MGIRLAIVGSSCSGKTTLARMLAELLAIPQIELDSLFWQANWRESSDDEFFPKLSAAVAQESWVMDGNYGRTRSISWPRLTHVIWLDLPLWLVLFRLVERSLRRSLSQELLWGSCQENLWHSLFSRKSLLMWILKNRPIMKQRYESAMADPSYSHINFIRLRSPAEVKAFRNEAPLQLRCHQDL